MAEEGRRLDIDVDAELDLSGEPAPGKDEPKAAAKKRGSAGSGSKTRPQPSESELRKRIDDGLAELVSVLRDFLGAEEIAQSVEMDSKRMADVLAAHANKRPMVGRIVVWLFGKDSALAAARAFGPTLRRVGRAWRWRRDRARERTPEGTADLEGWQDENGVYHVGERPAP